MKTIPISIIIPVSKDIKIKECLNSIRDDLEIVVVLNNNPSEEVINIVRNDKRCIAIFLNTVGCNLSQALNIGVQKAKNEKIIIMNSDCVFPEGILDKIDNSLDDVDVVKARVSLLYNTFLESLVAKVRYLYNHIFNNQRNIFCPGVAFNKKIISKIGGYLFDEDMGWGEDADLSRRIHKFKLPYVFIKEEIIHLPESIFHDLKTAMKIGIGKRIRDYKDDLLFKMGVKNLFYDIVFDRKEHFRLSFKHYGLIVTMYLIVWKIFYFFGYIYAINLKKFNKT